MYTRTFNLKLAKFYHSCLNSAQAQVVFLAKVFKSLFLLIDILSDFEYLILYINMRVDLLHFNS